MQLDWRDIWMSQVKTLIPLSLLYWISLLFSSCDFPCFFFWGGGGVFCFLFQGFGGYPAWKARKIAKEKARKSKKARKGGSGNCCEDSFVLSRVSKLALTRRNMNRLSSAISDWGDIGDVLSGDNRGGFPHRSERCNAWPQWCRDTRTVMRMRHHFVC